MRIDPTQSGWWPQAIRQQCWPAGHRCAPADHAVREAAAAARREVSDTAASSATWADRTERLPERLSYARHLARRNAEAARPAQVDGAETEAPKADRGWARLGDVERAQTEVERRVQTAYRVRLITPMGRYIDAWM